MSKVLKAASFAAVAMSTIAVLSVNDMSFAFEAGSETASKPELVDSVIETESDSTESKEITSKPTVVFAEPKEVVQELPSEGDPKLDGETTTDAKSLRELVSWKTVPKTMGKQMECLAGTVYFESKGEPLEGQLAVARVVLGREKSSRFPNSICGVVYQRSQFSFVRGGKMPRIRKGTKAWRNAVAIAQIAQENSWKSPVEGALFFHARYVQPRWKLKRIAAVDNHIFYR